MQPVASCSIFKLCLSAEEIPAQLDTYRDKLVCLQKLRFTPALYDSLPDFCKDAVLLHLSGMLYVNFSPLWDPVIEIIASFAQSSNVSTFWKIFCELLHTSAVRTGNNCDNKLNITRLLLVDSWSRAKAKYCPPGSNCILVARFPHNRGYLIFFYLILQLHNT